MNAVDEFTPLRQRVGDHIVFGGVKYRLPPAPLPVPVPQPIPQRDWLWVGGAMPEPSIKQIVAVVSEHYQIESQHIFGNRRNRKIVHARQVAFYLCTALTRYSLPQIGRALKRDHTTILYGRNKMALLRATEPRFDAELRELRNRCIAAGGCGR